MTSSGDNAIIHLNQLIDGPPNWTTTVPRFAVDATLADQG